MRLILFYDLPTTEPKDVKNYTVFHKWIISRGYIMMQYSVYQKVLNAPSKFTYERTAIEKHTPAEGNVRLLMVTETQYQNIRYLRGGVKTNEAVNNTDRYVKI